MYFNKTQVTPFFVVNHGLGETIVHLHTDNVMQHQIQIIVWSNLLSRRHYRSVLKVSPKNLLQSSFEFEDA